MPVTAVTGTRNGSYVKTITGLVSFCQFDVAREGEMTALLNARDRERPRVAQIAHRKDARMSLVIGLDTGGTYTDAALLDVHRDIVHATGKR